MSDPAARCPVCSQNLVPPDEYWGKNWRCPACNTGVRVFRDRRVERWGSARGAAAGAGRRMAASLPRWMAWPERLAVVGMVLGLAGLVHPIATSPGATGPSDVSAATWLVVALLVVAGWNLLLKAVGAQRGQLPAGYLLVGTLILILGALDFSRLSSPEAMGGPAGRLILVLSGWSLLVAWALSDRVASSPEGT